MTNNKTDTIIPQLRAPDVQGMQKAIHNFLVSAGFSLDHPHLDETPQRVTQCWLECLLNGYQMDPKDILGETFPAEEKGLVLIRDIAFHGLCPHHLLPFTGKAHIAFLPNEKLIGFSKLADLVRCFTQRLVLQETANQLIIQAITDELQVKGAGCILEGQHACMTLRDAKHKDCKVVTSAFSGVFEEKPEWQLVLFNRNQ